MKGKILKFPAARKLAGTDATPAAVGRIKRRKHRSIAKEWLYNVLPASMPLLSELMASCRSAPPLPQGQALMEAGVLAYRCRKNGEPEILMVSKRRSKKWGIPKGRVEPHLNFGELAAKEAFEEAGVVGYVSPSSVGMFRARRRTENALSHQIIEVWVYLFEVTRTQRKWPEMHKRQTRWVSCQVAAQQLREPVLTALCHRLAQHRSAAYTERRGG
jgi:8-oxo-dGTP pyrophosphatase MutT (NUDIX family)